MVKIWCQCISRRAGGWYYCLLKCFVSSLCFRLEAFWPSNNSMSMLYFVNNSILFFSFFIYNVCWFHAVYRRICLQMDPTRKYDEIFFDAVCHDSSIFCCSHVDGIYPSFFAPMMTVRSMRDACFDIDKTRQPI